MADPNTKQDAWQRLKSRKVMQWTLAFIALGFALLQGVDILVGAFEWPRLITRLLFAALVIGAAATAIIAWYHGDRGQQRLSGTELGIFTVLLLVGGVLLWVVSRNHSPAALRAETAAVAQSASPAPMASVAVMPFVNLTGDASKEYLGDGLAEELINSLAKLPGLHIPARTSSFAYKGRNTDIRQIGKDLDVYAILEGSVRSAGERIRVTAQLVNAETGYHFWSQNYDRQSTDLFGLQDELAATIVKAIGTTMKIDLPAVNGGGAPTANQEAYEMYLQGRTLTARFNPVDFPQGFQLLQKSLERDPTFGRPAAVLAYIHAGNYMFGAPPADLEAAEADARKALALDPQLAQAEVALALTRASRGDWLAAAEHTARAATIDPGDPSVWQVDAINIKGSAGLLRAAETAMLEAARLGPADSVVRVSLAALQAIQGHDEQSRRNLDRAYSLGLARGAQPAPQIELSLALHAGKPLQTAADVQRRWDDVVRAFPNATPAEMEPGKRGTELVVGVLKALADPSLKPAALTAVRASTSKMPASQDMVLLYVLLGDLDGAFQTLDRMQAGYRRDDVTGPPTWVRLWAPELATLRRDPRFSRWIAGLKLMPYWQKYGPPDGCTLAGDKLSCS